MHLLHQKKFCLGTNLEELQFEIVDCRHLPTAEVSTLSISILDMPRQAHGRPLTSTGQSKTRKRKPTKGRGLHALETAEKQFPEKIKIRQHRLGEAEEDDEDVPQNRADVDERSAKRRKIDTNDDDVDSMDEGSDLDGERWHVGVDDEDEDSDIDSDEAFGESDEERFAGFTFRGSSSNTQNSKSRKKRSNVNAQNEDSDDQDNTEDMSEADDDDLGEDAIDLAAALDMNEAEEQEVSVKRKKTMRKTLPSTSSAATGSNSEDSGSESQDSSKSDAQSDFSEIDDGNDPNATDGLRKFIDGLTPAEKEEIKSKRVSSSSTLPSKPSQFALPSTGLSAADLMQYVKDPAQRQSLKILQAAEREEPQPYKGGIPGKLAAPLAKRQQDRLDRVAAYDQGKQTLERWVDTVKQNRRAEHVSYPLIDAAKASAANVRSFQPISKDLPQSNLESKIQQILVESGAAVGGGKDEENTEQRYEELQEKKIPLDEVQARRRELRLQRELMFREEIRAKRIKKIKSKAFRRVHRKERDKFAVQERERLAAAGMLDSDEERERNDRRRAEERMGARHRESKWAKAAKATGQTTWNEDAKAGVSELARRDEELRRRIEGKSIHDSDDDGIGSDSDSDDYSATDDEDERWKQKLDTLSSTPNVNGKSKLANMAFMKKAEATKQAENDEEIRLLRRAMNEGEHEESGEGSDTSERPVRQKFGKSRAKATNRPAKPAERNEFEARLSDDDFEEEQEDQPTSAEPLPVQEAKLSTSRPQGTGGRGAGGAIASNSKPQLSGSVVIPSSQSKASSKLSRPGEGELNDYTSPSESEDEVMNNGLDEKSRLAMEIFAGDDDEEVKTQFAKEKKQTVEEEGDQVVDNTLPGWGSWTGAGISKREKKKGKGQVLSTIKGIAPEARKDARLERVIINEKTVKKNGKYLAAELPHPFESRQQYERALRLPMGPEWSTRNHFQDAIKPRVLLKQGQVIKPMSRPTA